MVFNKINGDLFTTSEDIVHCISADCALGAGIAKEINNRFQTKAKLYPYRREILQHFKAEGGVAVRTGRIINLVTKEHYYDKPTYQTLACALYGLKRLCTRYNIKKLSMPAIGCGLDKLDLAEVEDLIHQVFIDSDIEVTMYIK